ncbi:hypothetical protein D3C81_2142900 [compost metagenome]
MEVGADIAQGERQHLATGSAGVPDGERLVVEIEHGDAIGFQPIDDLALGLDDFFRSAELADVGRACVVEHGHMRLGHGDGVGNFAEP